MRCISEKIFRNCGLATQLAGLVSGNPRLDLLAPTALNICCLRYDPGGMPDIAPDEPNAEIEEQLHLRGLAAPSTTRIDVALRSGSS